MNVGVQHIDRSIDGQEITDAAFQDVLGEWRKIYEDGEPANVILS